MSMMLLGLASLGLVSCRGGDTPIETPAEQHDSSTWFTEDELAKVGLSGLTCPTGCTGEISTSVHWFNGGYSSNPSARYTFYYVRDTELEDRYLKQDAVWSFDIRYEATDGVYKLKIFVENASLSRNGARINFFNL